jgi:hypothetical protein
MRESNAVPSSAEKIPDVLLLAKQASSNSGGDNDDTADEEDGSFSKC